MKILLTGATGFIGGRLLEAFSMFDDDKIYCIARKTRPPDKIKNMTWIEQDLSQRLDLSLLPKKVDTIIHLAQSKNYRNFPEQAIDIFDVNVFSTIQLLDYGRRAGIKSFVFASTGGVYGYKNSVILETDIPNPLGFYPCSKYVSEYLTKSYCDYFHTAILRYFFVYGEGQRDMLIPNLVANIENGRNIVIHNRLGRRINPIYVDDAVQGTIAAMSFQGNEIINVAGNEVINILELSELLGQLINKKPVFQFVTESGESDLVADIGKMKSKLGIIPKIKLKEGLSRVIAKMYGGRAAS